MTYYRSELVLFIFGQAGVPHGSTCQKDYEYIVASGYDTRHRDILVDKNDITKNINVSQLCALGNGPNFNGRYSEFNKLFFGLAINIKSIQFKSLKKHLMYNTTEYLRMLAASLTVQEIDQSQEILEIMESDDVEKFTKNYDETMIVKYHDLIKIIGPKKISFAFDILSNIKISFTQDDVWQIISSILDDDCSRFSHALKNVYFVEQCPRKNINGLLEIILDTMKGSTSKIAILLRECLMEHPEIAHAPRDIQCSVVIGLRTNDFGLVRECVDGLQEYFDGNTYKYYDFVCGVTQLIVQKSHWIPTIRLYIDTIKTKLAAELVESNFRA